MVGQTLGLAAVVVLLAACGGAAGAGGPPVPLRVTVATGALTPSVATALVAGPGRAYTAAHALAGARAGDVRVGGRAARVLQVDRRLDLAVLAVPGLPAAAARPRAAARAGQAVTVRVLRSGRPRAIRARVLRRATVAITAHGTRVAGRPALELAAAGVRGGDSGAPVTDARGRVVGMVFARASDRAAAWAVALDPS